MLRPLWVGPLAVLGYGLALTKSRGGLITLMAGLMILFFARFRARFGLVKTALLAGLVLPPVLLVFGGRMTEISTKTSTASERMDLWEEAYSDLRHTPLGLGVNEFDKKMGLVVHNSFLHAFVESGVVGGTFFLGAFVCALWGCARLGSKGVRLLDPEMRRLRPFVLAVVGAYAAGLLSLSRCYAEPTYTMLAVGAACASSARLSPVLAPLRLGPGLLLRLALAAALYLAGGYALFQVR
jgi:O-antigen ligase